MKPDKDPAYLLDIYQSAQLIVEFAGNMDRETFSKDLLHQYAIVRCVEIIGEAVKRLSATYKAAHPEIPWKQMAGIRDIVIHHYDRVDWDEVWAVVHDDIPKLIKQMGPLIPPEKKD